MRLRLSRRRFGILAAASVLAGCAMPPGPQSDAGGAHLATTNAPNNNTTVLAPQPVDDGSSLAAMAASNADSKDNDKDSKDSTLADAEPLGDNSPDVSSFHETGRASWYGRGFHGRRTANGERYDMHALTAAHRTLPLGSYVRVSVPATAKWVVVRINDRGPFVRGRVIDLSYAAAVVLGLDHVGMARVKIEGLSSQQAKVARAEMLAENSNVDR